MTTTTVSYSPDGNEAVYFPEQKSCVVTVRGYKTPEGRFVKRGGPLHPEDKAITNFTFPQWDAIPVPLFHCEDRVRETFEDALHDRRDLFGKPMFRNTPAADEKHFFFAAYDAAQKVRSKVSVLGTAKVIFVLTQSLFAFVDCFARDKDGAFWLLSCATKPTPDSLETSRMSLAAYILEAGGYVPPCTTIRCGVWSLCSTGATSFHEVTNDRALARDLVIDKLTTPPF